MQLTFLISRCTWCVSLQRWRFGGCTRYDSTLAQPRPDDAVKEYPDKIKSIVDEISKLTLIEVADLNELLKVMIIYVNNSYPYINYAHSFRLNSYQLFVRKSLKLLHA